MARLLSFTNYKFTDQQSHVHALLILTHAAIQVVYIRQLLWNVCGMLNFDTYG